jgi:hypothetical protein
VLVVSALSYLAAGEPVSIWVAVLGAAALVIVAWVALKVGLSNFRGRHYLWFGYCVLLLGCWALVPAWFGATRVTVAPEPRLEKDPRVVGPVRAVYAGAVLGACDAGADSAFKIRGFQPNLFSVERLGPDGWAPCPLDWSGDRVAVKSPPTTWLYIDNARNGAARLQCGQLSWDVAAGAHERVAIPTPLGRQALIVNGAPVGDLADGQYLVDATGARSYRLREHLYADSMTQSLVSLQAFHDFTGGPKAPGSDMAPGIRAPVADAYFGRAGLHKLPCRIDYFLEPAEHEVTVSAYAHGLVSRVELLETD